MRALVPLAVGMALCGACILPRDNPFDRADIETAYNVTVSAPDGVLTVVFNKLDGAVRGYRVYRENIRGERALLTELAPDVTTFIDTTAVEGAEVARDTIEDGTLYWRVAGFHDQRDLFR